MRLHGGPLDGADMELSGLAPVTEFAVMCGCGGACFDSAQYRSSDGTWIATVCEHRTRGGDPVGRRRVYEGA